MAELVGLDKYRSTIERSNALVVTITSDGWDRIERSDIHAPTGLIHLSDPAFKIIKRYGLFDDDMIDNPLARPATVFIDADGRIESVFLTENWRIRLSTAQTLGLLLGGVAQ